MDQQMMSPYVDTIAVILTFYEMRLQNKQQVPATQLMPGKHVSACDVTSDFASLRA
jgi:hypothetical protein